MQLFESYEFISRAVMALVLLALLIFYIISLRLTVKRQVRIIKSLRQHSLAEELGVTDKITFAGFRSPEEVRAAMEESEIYLVTSDRKEGWGAVVNEAMNSGCAVVADHMIGAAPWMIRQRENGILYHDGCEQQLQEYVAELLQDPAECRRLGEAAQQTVRTEWNARTAAERLVRLCREMGFLGGADGQCLPSPPVPALWTDGPCSPAPVIPERRMYRYLTERNEEDRT